VDGELRGERPVHREELPPGTHTLRFERPGFAAVDTTVTLRAGTNGARDPHAARKPMRYLGALVVLLLAGAEAPAQGLGERWPRETSGTCSRIITVRSVACEA